MVGWLRGRSLLVVVGQLDVVRPIVRTEDGRCGARLPAVDPNAVSIDYYLEARDPEDGMLVPGTGGCADAADRDLGGQLIAVLYFDDGDHAGTTRFQRGAA